MENADPKVGVFAFSVHAFGDGVGGSLTPVVVVTLQFAHAVVDVRHQPVHGVARGCEEGHHQQGDRGA